VNTLETHQFNQILDLIIIRLELKNGKIEKDMSFFFNEQKYKFLFNDR